MIAVKLLSEAEIRAKLEADGFRDTGKQYPSKEGNYAIWITEWGEPLMVPQEGPDKMCAQWVLLERMAKVLATKPKRK